MINRKNEIELQNGINNQDILEYWETIKDELIYDNYFITEIKYDGIECILVNQNNSIVIDEMNIEIAGTKNRKTSICNINTTLNKLK